MHQVLLKETEQARVFQMSKLDELWDYETRFLIIKKHQV
jgi:hypothetical protein